MTLRTRLLLGYGYLVVLLLATAAVSALGLQRFARSLDRVLNENVTSVQATMDMLDALERQRAATFGLLLGDQAAAALLEAADDDFDRALQLAREHAFVPGEAELVEALERELAALRKGRVGLFDGRSDKLLAAHEELVGPHFLAVKRDAMALLRANTAAIRDADQRAREEAMAFALGLAALVVIALLSLGFMSRALQQTILSRLAKLQELSDAIAAGDRARRFPVWREDELGVLARHLNVALDRQEALQAQMEGRFNQQCQLLLGHLARLDAPSALVALDGDVIASTLSVRAEARVSALAERIRAERKGATTQAGKVTRRITDGEGVVTLELLVANGARAVGWFVTVEEAPAGGKPATPMATPAF